MKNRFLLFVFLLISSTTLISCGSGNSGGGFNLANMYNGMIAQGATFNTTGLCTGSLYTVNNPIYTIYSSNNTVAVPASQLMFGNFGSIDPTNICGPGHFGGLNTPPLTAVTNNYGLPTAAIGGSSGTFYTYTQTVNGLKSGTGTVTWTLSSSGGILTLTDTNLNYPSGISNYTSVRTFSINSIGTIAVPTGLTITVGGGSGGVITGTASTIAMPALNLQTAYQSFIINGWSDNLTVAGSCTGTLSMTQTAVSGATVTFNGASAYPATYTQVGNLVGANAFCSSGTFSGTRTIVNYYNSTQVQLGNNVPSYYTNITGPTTSLLAGPTHATLYTYTQPSNVGTIIYSVAPPAIANGLPVLFTYQVNTVNSTSAFNYADVMVLSISAGSTLTPVAYSYTDNLGNNLTGY